MSFLIFDGQCSLCGKTALDLGKAGEGRFEILPIQTDEAKELLDRAFPEGWEKDVYYVETKGDTVHAYRGPRAAWKVMLKTGVRDFWRATHSLFRIAPKPLDVESVRGAPHVGRRTILQLMIYGTAFLGLGALMGRSGRLEEVVGKAVGISRPCSKVDISDEEAEQWKLRALADGETNMVRTFLAEEGFTEIPEHAYISKSRCDNKEKIAVSFPHLKLNGTTLEGKAITVFVSEDGGTRAFGASVTRSLEDLDVQHFRVIKGRIAEVETSGSETPTAGCDWFCFNLCVGDRGFSFWGNCFLRCAENCSPGIPREVCWELCGEMCDLLTVQYCCGLCNCDPCPT